jgi:glycosyltransferase involved in cell wall biosynthesis
MHEVGKIRSAMIGSILVSTPDLRPSLLSILPGLVDRNLIGRVATTISIPSAFSRSVVRVPWAGPRLAPLLKRREVPAFLEGIVDNIWAAELARNVSSRVANEMVTDAIFNWATNRFDKTVARRYAGRYPYIYGMDFSSGATFAAQKAQGGYCIQRQVSAHFSCFTTMLRRECERFPDLVTDYHRLILRVAEQHQQQRAIEHELADLIVANSDYVRTTFIEYGIPASKVTAVPTGCPPVDPTGARSGGGAGPLRFIYAGRLSLRKGFHYLMQAWRLADFGSRAELWIAGGSELGMGNEIAAHPNIHYFGSLSFDALADIYRKADVMVLPTLSEGLAHAVLEGLSFGMPVITTVASGVGTLVTNGENGFIVPEADAEALAAAMAAAVAGRSGLPKMGQLSRQRAQGWTVADSNAEHASVIVEFLEARG